MAHPGLGNLIQALSKRMDEMQREMAGLRQDVRTLTFLIREQRAEIDEHYRPDEQDASEDEQQDEA